MQSELAAGTLVGGFRVVSLIGEGAMGTVYLAEDASRPAPESRQYLA